MKIYYYLDQITDNVFTHCDIADCNIGSVACQNCKHCYGTSKRISGLIGYAGKDGKLSIHYDDYVKCAALFDKPTLRIKILCKIHAAKVWCENSIHDFKYWLFKHGITKNY